MTAPRTWIVVLDATPGRHVYLGELDRGARQGVTRLANATRFTRLGAARVAAHYRGARVLDTSLPACAIELGCLCAFHARGGNADATCDASERAVPCDKCGHLNDIADECNYCTSCRDAHRAQCKASHAALSTGGAS